jgi:hypothetical protein
MQQSLVMDTLMRLQHPHPHPHPPTHIYIYIDGTPPTIACSIFATHKTLMQTLDTFIHHHEIERARICITYDRMTVCWIKPWCFSTSTSFSFLSSSFSSLSSNMLSIFVKKTMSYIVHASGSDGAMGISSLDQGHHFFLDSVQRSKRVRKLT